MEWRADCETPWSIRSIPAPSLSSLLGSKGKSKRYEETQRSPATRTLKFLVENLKDP